MASDAALSKYQSILDAQREVRPMVGEINVNIASDSAESVYGAALDALGVDKAAHPKEAWRSVFQVLKAGKLRQGTASDAAPVPAESPLGNIQIL